MPPVSQSPQMFLHPGHGYPQHPNPQKSSCSRDMVIPSIPIPPNAPALLAWQLLHSQAGSSQGRVNKLDKKLLYVK